MTLERFDGANRRWLDTCSPWRAHKVRLRALCRPGESAADALNAIGAGDSGRPYILEDSEYRELHFTRNASQSSMLIADPTELVPRPKRILMIGLGGGSLAKYCYRHLPAASIVVVEPNAEVIALRGEFHIPPDDDRFSVVQADGAEFMSRTAEAFDVVLIDAFDTHGIARTLESEAFYASLARRLAPHGSMVMNFWGDVQRLAAHTRFAQALLDTPLVLVPVEYDSNVLLFALGQPRLQSAPDTLASAAKRLERALKMNFTRYLRRISEGTMVGGLPGTQMGIGSKR
jgi:spermidine synthase